MTVLDRTTPFLSKEKEGREGWEEGTKEGRKRKWKERARGGLLFLWWKLVFLLCLAQVWAHVCWLLSFINPQILHNLLQNASPVAQRLLPSVFAELLWNVDSRTPGAWVLKTLLVPHHCSRDVHPHPCHQNTALCLESSHYKTKISDLIKMY